MRIYILILFSVFSLSCGRGFKNKQELNKAYSLYEKGKNEDDDKALQDAGKKYQEIINQKIYAQDRLASVYRALAERSLAKTQYGYAAQYFAEGLKILPNSAYLRYGLGISYANLIESSDTEEKKKDFIERAYNNIKFAVEKDPENANYNAAYASILTAHLNRPKEALPHIEKALSVYGNNIDYLFVLARVQYEIGENEASANTYRNIIALSGDERVRKQAEDNIKRLIGR